MQSYGFTESAGDWWARLIGYHLFAKNDYKLLPESQQQNPNHGSQIGLDRANACRMDGRADNYGEDRYNEGLSLERAILVADAWAMGRRLGASNLTTQGLGKRSHSQ
ncbi:OmpA family protein [Escherichia coli]